MRRLVYVLIRVDWSSLLLLHRFVTPTAIHPFTHRSFYSSFHSTRTPMGCCCSCLDQDGAPGGANRETELAVAQAEKKALSISRAMSAPSIDVDNGTTVSGFGLAIAGVSIEQDAAYWEVQVDIPDGQSAEIMFGVATKKDQKFYAAFQEQEEGTSGGSIDDDVLHQWFFYDQRKHLTHSLSPLNQTQSNHKAPTSSANSRSRTKTPSVSLSSKTISPWYSSSSTESPWTRSIAFGAPSIQLSSYRHQKASRFSWSFASPTSNNYHRVPASDPSSWLGG